MQKSAFILAIILTIQTQAQVIDVNGDKTVGAEEAIAVAEQWKQEAKRANDHNHLGQTWTGDQNPLVIRGNFPDRNIIIGPTLKKGIESARSPLILDNTAENSGDPGADLILRGYDGVLATDSGSLSSLTLRSNRSIRCYLDADNDTDGSVGAHFEVRNGEGFLMFQVNESGNVYVLGNVTEQGGIKTKIDHPLDPANKYLLHSSVESPEMKNVYDGVVVLDENGEAEVQLPDYFEAFNRDFRYTLTAIGGPAPNLHVAEKVEDNQFKIAGGNPNQEISWQVTGIRRDAYAKANPIQVEEEKSDGEKGKYLNPRLFGEPLEKSVGLAE